MENALNEVLALKGQALVGAVCLIAGYILKMTPAFPNRYIPHLVILFGGGLNPCIIGRGNVSPDINNPVAHLVLQGLVIGACAFAAHHLVIGRIEARIRALFPEVEPGARPAGDDKVTGGQGDKEKRP